MISNRVQRVLLVCGILAALLYVAMNVVVARQWEGYSFASRTVSELSAIDAPTRELWLWLAIPYGLLAVAFGCGVWASAAGSRALRVAGGLMIADGIFGFAWPPMQLREVVAVNGPALTDTLHIVFAAWHGILSMLAIGFAAAALGKRFRIYSIATIAFLLAAGYMTSLDAPNVQANLPTPWIGVWERILIAADLAWIVVFAGVLLRRIEQPDERVALRGDDFLPAARAQATHHIDIDAPPADVWPWLVQMGRRRGGWYSWDLLDNGGVRSADRIVPALQKLRVGDVLPIKPTGPEGMHVLVLEPPHALVLGDPSLVPEGPKPRPGAPRATWAFSLEPIGDHGTHLVVRVRADYEPSFLATVVRHVVAAAHDVMERKQLRTLKQRAETG
jgi:hypothetical protein